MFQHVKIIQKIHPKSTIFLILKTIGSHLKTLLKARDYKPGNLMKLYVQSSILKRFCFVQLDDQFASNLISTGLIKISKLQRACGVSGSVEGMFHSKSYDPAFCHITYDKAPKNVQVA